MEERCIIFNRVDFEKARKKGLTSEMHSHRFLHLRQLSCQAAVHTRPHVHSKQQDGQGFSAAE